MPAGSTSWLEAFANDSCGGHCRLKTTIRRLRVVSPTLAAILSSTLTAEITVTLHKVIRSCDIGIEDPSAWAETRKLWPTIGSW